LSKLFIIGNGFDLAHGIPTTFNHFKEYLRNNYKYDYDEYPSSLWLDSRTSNDGSQIYDDDQCAKIIDFMICEVNLDREDWNDFEKSMGHFDYSLIEDEIEEQYDKEGDVNPFYSRNNYEQAYNDLSNVMSRLTYLFSNWIETIKIPENCYSVFNLNTYYNFSELIDVNNDTFLSFNYTETLEKLYEVDTVTHIHGKQNGNIIIGHNVHREFDEKAYGQDLQMDSMHKFFEKPTTEIIYDNSDFFTDLEDIDSIYSYGFSFGCVDLPYIKEIIKNINTSNMTWYLHSYNKELEKKQFKEIIKECGFLGSFDEFD